MAKKYISSEEYRQRLVRDGDRRFQEWHTQYLEYQKSYLQALAKSSRISQDVSV